MLAPGHVAVGFTTYMGLSAFYGHNPSVFDYTAVFLGSLLPDIDHPYSRVGKTFPRISNAIAGMFGHRGFTHSLLAIILFTTILMQTLESAGQSTPSTVLAALCFGYVSHVLADFCTHAGIPLLWPYRRRWKNGNERGYRLPLLHFTTGGTFEYVLTTALALLLAFKWVY